MLLDDEKFTIIRYFCLIIEHNKNLEILEANDKLRGLTDYLLSCYVSDLITNSTYKRYFRVLDKCLNCYGTADYSKRILSYRGFR